MHVPGIVVRGGVVIADSHHDPQWATDVWIRGSTIEAILPTGARAVTPETKVIEAGNCIVMPGLIDTHRHLWQTPLRGLGADLIAPEYRHGLREVVAQHYRPQDVYAATLAGALDALDSGVTTILDWAHIMNSPEHADASVAALRDSGMRAVFAHSAPNNAEPMAWWSNSDKKHPLDATRIRREVLADDNALVTMAFAARAPHLVQREVMIHDWSLARELELRIIVDGGIGGGLWGPRKYPIRLLREDRLLGSDTTYVHCNNLAEDEYDSIKSSGGSVSISPCAEMHVGFGFPGTRHLLEHGIRPALSVDYVTQVAGDMFGTMRSTLATERAILGNAAFEAGRGVSPWTLRTPDVLEFATERGAEALGHSKLTGVIAPGMQADIVLLRTDSVRLSPVNDPIATAVLFATPADVNTVLVAGRIVKRDGVLTTCDSDRVQDAVSKSRDYLLTRAGMRIGHGLAKLGR